MNPSPLDLGCSALELSPEEWRALLNNPEVCLSARWEDPARGLAGAVSDEGGVYAYPTPPRSAVMLRVVRELNLLPVWREARAWCLFLADQADPPPGPEWFVIRSGEDFRAFLASLSPLDVLVRVCWDRVGDPVEAADLLTGFLAERPGLASLCQMDFRGPGSELMRGLWQAFLAAPSAAAGSPRLHFRSRLQGAGPLASRALREAEALAFFG